MSELDIILPFKLKLEDLPFVEIVCKYQPDAKSEKHEWLRISSVLGVLLAKQESTKDKPEELKGKIASEALIPLLTILESEGFFELPDDDIDDETGPVRSMSLSLPARKKQVVMTGIKFRELDYLTGAVKMTAGLSVSEALGRKFLKFL
jgi:hypothetical protein